MKNYENSPENACTEPISTPSGAKNSIAKRVKHKGKPHLYMLNCLFFKQNTKLFSKNLIKLLTFIKNLLTNLNFRGKVQSHLKQITVLQGVGSRKSSQSMNVSNLNTALPRIFATRSKSLQSPHLHDSLPIGTIHIFLCSGAA